MAMMMGRWFLTVTIGAALTASGCGPTPSTTVTGESGVVLPTGRVLRPTGRTIDVGNMPLAITIAPGGRFAMLLLSGWRERGLPTSYQMRHRNAARRMRSRLLLMAGGYSSRTLTTMLSQYSICPTGMLIVQHRPGPPYSQVAFPFCGIRRHSRSMANRCSW